MKIYELINKLEELKFEIGNVRKSKYYKKNKNVEVRLAFYMRASKKNDKSISKQAFGLKRFAIEDIGVNSENIYEYIDNGFSGTMVYKRPQYNKMNYDLETKKINVVVTTHIDRFGRASDEIMARMYPEGEMRCLFINTDCKYINAPNNRGLIQKQSLMAEEQAAICSLKSKRGIKTSMYAGSVINSKAPYGYKIEVEESSGIRKFILGDHDQVETVKEIFQLYLIGKSMEEISKIITNKKIPTPSGKSIWNKKTIEFILKNPLYTGELYQGRYEKLNYTYVGDGFNIEKKDPKDWIHGGTFEGIIDKKIFESVKSMIEENRSIRTNGERKLFTGVLKCGDCGRALIFRKKAHGYLCSGNMSVKNTDTKCTTHLVKEDELYKLIKPKITYKICENKARINKEVTSKMKSNALCNINKNTLEKINCEIDKVSNRLADIYINNDDIKFADKIIKQIELRLEELENERERIKDQIKVEVELQKEIDKTLNDLDKIVQAKNDTIRLFIKKILIYQDGRIEIDWRC